MGYANVKFTPNRTGIGNMLNSGFMVRGMEIYAEAIKLRAQAMAPVYHGPGRDEHRGRYKASFHVTSHRFGGATNDRAEAVVYNDSPEAGLVEWGYWGREPYHLLSRAAFGGVGRSGRGHVRL